MLVGGSAGSVCVCVADAATDADREEEDGARLRAASEEVFACFSAALLRFRRILIFWLFWSPLGGLRSRPASSSFSLFVRFISQF